MSKRAAQAPDARQMDLLDLLQRAETPAPAGPAPGSLDYDARLRAALSEELRRYAGDRFDVAAKMSRLVGAEVTKWQLDSWTAESKEGHRFPASHLPAFCCAVGSYRVLQVLAEGAGRRVYSDPSIDVAAEIGRLETNIQQQRAELRERERMLRAAKETYGEILGRRERGGR
jgi:hypothetical protein